MDSNYHYTLYKIYLDIFVLGSNVDGLFVAKSEIDSWPFINKICALGRTIFVNRNDIIKVKGQMNQITNTLKSGYSVILFPEGWPLMPPHPG